MEVITVDKEHLEYLDQLRETGLVNMFGASRNLEVDYGMEEDEAKATLVYWMTTYATRNK